MNKKTPYIVSNAKFDQSRKYRYRLTRRWDGLDDRYILFVCLNPSTADETEDARTVGRCVGFAKREGYSAMHLVNIFSIRATDPKEMKSVNNPGADAVNSAAIIWSSLIADKIVLAYGNHGAHRGRHKEILHLLRNYKLHCFGTTKSGLPKHPLYLRADTPIIPFER